MRSIRHAKHHSYPVLPTVCANFPLDSQTRGFSAQASPKVASAKADIETTTLQNKVVVASVENQSPITRVSIVFR